MYLVLPFTRMSSNFSILQRAKLLITLLVLFLGLPAVALGTYLIFQQAKDDHLKSLGDRAPLVVQLIENDILAKQQALMHAATLLEAESIEQITQHQLDGIVEGFSGVVWAGVTDQVGKVLVGYQKFLEGVDVSKRPWFNSGLKGPSVLDRHDALLLAKLLPARPEPYRFIDIAVPIRSPAGQTLGVLALHLDWIWYQNQFPSLIGKANRDSSVSYVVFGKDDEVRLLKASQADSVLISEKSFENGISSALANNFYFVKQSGPNDGVLDNLDWTLYVLQNKQSTYQATQSSALFSLLMFLLGLSAALTLFFQLTKRVSRSSSEFIEALVSKDFELLERVRPNLPKEILPLSTKAEFLISELRERRSSLESALEEVKDNYLEINRLVTQAPLAIAMFDREMKYISRSNLWQTTYLSHVANPIGKSHYDLIPAISEIWRDVHQRGLNGETVKGQDDIWYDLSGRKFWLNWTVQPWTTPDERVGGIIITAEDVTVANQSKIALAESEERFMLAMKGSHDGLWDWNLQTNEIYFSPSWKSMLGYEPEELEASFETWERLLHPEDRDAAKRVVMLALDDANQLKFSGAFRLAHRHGHWVSILSRGIILRDNGGKATRMVGTHLDRTEFEHLQGELNEAWVIAQAEASSNESKSKFLATVSHEIRNPLNSICGFARLIHDELSEPELKRYAQLLMQTTDSLTVVLNDLLDFAKIDAGKLELRKEPFSLAAIMEELAEGSRLVCREKNVDFEFSTRWSRQTTYLGDVGRIRQIVQNLLINAVKFTHQGQVTLRVVTTQISDESDRITIEVQDSGIGMPKDKLDKLFKPFSQVHIDQGNKYGGTGLGLSIVKSLIELMYGRVDCESEPGVGSKFSVMFDLEISTLVTPTRFKAGLITESKSILIADDSPTNLNVLSAFLNKRGHHVVAVKCGDDALRHLEESQFDFALLDMDMPGMSGLQVVNAMKLSDDAKCHTQFVCISGHADQVMTNAALSGGFDQFFPKPLNFDDLLRYISSK